jgi:hypothetical protein
MKVRTIYQQSKLIAEQMSSGNDRTILNRVVSIIITNYNLVDDDGEYHHQFRLRTVDGSLYINLIKINTLELSNLPSARCYRSNT